MTPPLLSLAQEEELIQSENSASIFNTLSDIPSQMEDAELLLGEAMRLAGSLTDVAVETQRRKHLAYLLADQGQLLGTSPPTNLSQVGLRAEPPGPPLCHPLPSSAPRLGLAPQTQLWRDTSWGGGRPSFELSTCLTPAGLGGHFP